MEKRTQDMKTRREDEKNCQVDEKRRQDENRRRIREKSWRERMTRGVVFFTGGQKLLLGNTEKRERPSNCKRNVN